MVNNWVQTWLAMAMLSSGCLGAIGLGEGAMGGAMKVVAEKVTFDGAKLHLVDNVSITHGLGVLTCDWAELFFKTGPGKETETVPEKIILRGNVRMRLSDGGSIDADQAEIDCLALDGLFQAEPPKKVACLFYLDGDEGVRTPIKATSRKMRVKMRSIEQPKGGTHYVISDFQGEDAVTIEYQQPVAPTPLPVAPTSTSMEL